MSDESIDLVNILKPDLDYRKYRYLHLANGLRAVLISDLKDGEQPMDVLSQSGSSIVSESGAEESEGDESESDGEESEKQKSAAALCIGIGSFSDPWECQGLAHYLEHMVFMGSEKYPSENDFESYISQRGGSTNAFTDDKKTVFYFNIRPSHFQASLDRFANFFISPLLKKDSMENELTAVHSEYEMARLNDYFRESGLLKTLAAEGHVYKKFCSGSKQSLFETPTSKGVDIYAYLKDLRVQMYSAHFMTLSVCAKDTLDNLEKMVTSIFSDIPKNDSPIPDFRHCPMPFETDAFTKLYKINPIKDSHSLEILWSLPSHYPEYKSHPLQIFGYLIGHEGPGSVISHLRKKNLAVNLVAGCSFFDIEVFNEMHEVLAVEITLTDKGLQNYEEVINVVFQYLNVLRTDGVPERVLTEYQELLKMNFRYSSMKGPLKSAMEVSQALQMVDDLDWLLARHRQLESYNHEEFQKILTLLKAEKACYLLKSKKFATECTLEEGWYGCQYCVSDIDPKKFAAWNVATPTEELHLPAANIFIPKNFDLLPIDGCPVDTPVDLTPTLTNFDAKHGCLYYKMDKNFRVPKACVKVILWSPLAMENQKNAVLHALFIYAVNQALIDIAYFATEASFGYDVSGSRSITLECNGFSNTLFLLYETLVHYVCNFTISNDQFDSYKDIFRQKYYTDWYKPQKLAQGLCASLLTTVSHMPFDLLETLRHLTVDDLRSYHKSIFSHIRISAYVHGNVTADEARKYFHYTIETLKFAPLEEVPRPQIRKKPIGDDRIRVFGLNPKDINTAVINNYQFGPVNIFKSCLLEVLGNILSEPAFNFLRTKETLGYSVGLYIDISYSIGSLSMLVASQADKFTLDHCHEKMDEFVKIVAVEKLKELSKSDLKDFVASAIAQRNMEDTQMLQEVQRNFNELIKEEFVFDRRQREIAALKSITKNQIIDLYNEIVLNAKTCKRLSIQVESKKNHQEESTLDEWTLILEAVPTLPDIQGTWLTNPKLAYEWEVYPHHKIVD